MATTKLTAAPIDETATQGTTVTTAVGIEGGAPRLEVERFTLANGLEVILHHDASVPLVAVNVWYHVGSGDEVPSQTGFAHLYEHLFKNGKYMGARKHYDVLREAGATGANATTSTDRTNYYETVPSHQLDLALWLESDRMGYFLPGLTDERIATQKDVVRNERRQRYENVAYGPERFALAELLYPEGHPQRYLTIGLHEDIQGATRKMVEDFYRTWYVPANATLTIAGDFSPETIRGQIDKFFGRFPPSVKPSRRDIAQPVIAEARRVDVADPLAKLVRFHRAWHTPGAMSEGDAALDLSAAILAAPGTGRLWKRLVHDTQLAQRVMVYQSGGRRGGTFQIVVDIKSATDRAAALAAVEAIVEDEIGRLIGEPVSDTELSRAKIRREAALIWRVEGLAARANQLQYYNAHLGEPNGFARELALKGGVSAAILQATAGQWLGRDRSATVITLPAGAQAAQP